MGWVPAMRAVGYRTAATVTRGAQRYAGLNSSSRPVTVSMAPSWGRWAGGARACSSGLVSATKFRNIAVVSAATPPSSSPLLWSLMIALDFFCERSKRPCARPVTTVVTAFVEDDFDRWPDSHTRDLMHWGVHLHQVAHVDHGKTTLVDSLFRSSLGAKEQEKLGERAMDTGDLEMERGITILSKVTALQVEGEDGERITLNIVDTPGHADFGQSAECLPQPFPVQRSWVWRSCSEFRRVWIACPHQCKFTFSCTFRR